MSNRDDRNRVSVNSLVLIPEGSPMLTERRVLITGGAGFIGSHLCDRLLERGDEVLCVDNFYTGTRRNVHHLMCIRALSSPATISAFRFMSRLTRSSTSPARLHPFTINSTRCKPPRSA